MVICHAGHRVGLGRVRRRPRNDTAAGQTSCLWLGKLSKGLLLDIWQLGHRAMNMQLLMQRQHCACLGLLEGPEVFILHKPVGL